MIETNKKIRNILAIEKETKFDTSNNYKFNSLTYSELLNTIEWRSLRSELLFKSDYHCCNCNRQETYKKWDYATNKWKVFNIQFPEYCKKYLNSISINNNTENFYIYDDRGIVYSETDKPCRLHIHHQYYIEDRLPWQYNLNCFQTMCEHCHLDLHERIQVPYYSWRDNILIENKDLIPCKRCKGAGIFPEYKHVESGICFRCHGAKYEQFI